MVAEVMANDVGAVYRASKKQRDINWFTEWISRPPAAVLVHGLRNSAITPNQISFASLVVASGAAALWALVPGRGASIAAAVIFQLSFVLDCADGQLARIRNQSSPLGHLVDFHLDEIKALVIYAAVSWRVLEQSGSRVDVAFALGGLVALASGLSLTSLTRRPEYGATPPGESGQPTTLSSPSSLLGRVVFILMWLARAVIHYPQYVWLFALFDRMDLFVYGYGSTVILYFLWTLAKVAFRLARFDSSSSMSNNSPTKNTENTP